MSRIELSVLTRAAADALFNTQTKRRFNFAIACAAAASLIEAAGVLAVLPLMQLLTGADTGTGVLGRLGSLLGDPSDDRLAIYLTIVTFTAFVLKGVITVAIRWWVLGFVFRQEAETSVRLLRHFLAAPYGDHLRRNSAEMIRTANDATGQVYNLVIVGTMSLIAESLTIVSLSIGLLIVMPVPTMVVGGYLVIAGLVFQRVVKRHARSAGDRLVASFTTIYQGALQALGGIKEIKIRRKSEFFLGEFRTARAEHAASRRTAVFLGELPKYVFEVLFIGAIALMSAVTFGTDDSSSALSMLALFAAAGFRILPSMVRMMTALNSIRVGSKALEIVLVDLAEAEQSEASSSLDREKVDPAARIELRRSLAVERITFSHGDASEPVLRDVSIDIKMGSSVALVGASGSGKSTLVDLVLGLHTPASGRIVVDGRDIVDELPLWQQSIGMVPQDVYLLDSSLRSNVAFGDGDDGADPARLADALDKSQLSDLVATLPDGLDTFVGERGVRLSGGQRQRIGIARALYASPELLIMDEATSALDNETEHRITETMNGLRGELTILIVAHRLSTVRDCDKIVFLKEGRVAATGTFDELREADVDFAHLAQLGSLG